MRWHVFNLSPTPCLEVPCACAILWGRKNKKQTDLVACLVARSDLSTVSAEGGVVCVAVQDGHGHGFHLHAACVGQQSLSPARSALAVVWGRVFLFVAVVVGTLVYADDSEAIEDEADDQDILADEEDDGVGQEVVFHQGVYAGGSVRAILHHDAEQQTPDLSREHDLKHAAFSPLLAFLSQLLRCGLVVDNPHLLAGILGRRQHEDKLQET